jgi:hypothetical protein
MKIIKRVTPPTGLRRELWRLPMLLYRIRLGRPMGHVAPGREASDQGASWRVRRA